MPSAGVIAICALVAGVLYVGDKVVHSNSIHTFNRGVCKVATLGKKCKPTQEVKSK